MKNLTTRHWGLFFTVVSAAVIAAVYFSQYVLKMSPCHLCLMERVPFYVAVILGAWLVVLAENKIAAKILLGLLVVAFLYSTGLSIFHFGVEQKWWIYVSDCTGQNTFKRGASIEEMRAALKRAPTVRCDQAVPFLFGMSMAFYNILTSIGLSALAVIALITSRNAVRG